MRTCRSTASLLCVIASSLSFGQSPDLMNYQAAARNATGGILANTPLTVRFTIHETSATGSTVYSETHNTTTTVQGMFDAQIGGGTATSGSFDAIGWGDDAHFLQVEVNAGSGYVDMGTTQLLSVPYALHARTSSGGWQLTGNAATDPGTAFIGTTDSQPLRFRINNYWAGELNPLTDNVSFGYNAGVSHAAGTKNTAIGTWALYNNTSGIENTSVGAQSLYFNTSGNKNTAVGMQALNYNSTGSNNTATGHWSLFSNTEGENNTGFGYFSLGTNSSGDNNTGVGVQSLSSNVVGTSNTGIGGWSLASNTDGADNTALGVQSLYANTSGISNTATGRDALYGNTTGSYNTASGIGAMYNNSTGSSNTAIGQDALNANVEGLYNTAVGSNAGTTEPGTYTTTTVGRNAAAAADGATALGFNATAPAANSIRIGSSANLNQVGIFGILQSLSDGRFKENVQENVPGLVFIDRLRPVTYNLNTRKIDGTLGVLQRMENEKDPTTKARYFQRLSETEAMVETGFIAQDVEEAARSIGFDFSGVHRPVNEKDHYTLGYAGFVVPLVKAVQELHAQNKELADHIVAHEQRLGELEKRLAEISSLHRDSINTLGHVSR
ncbi:MAG TPA: tail fiber domain-containing protein [Flavobacteriales bacterium]|nr:tail fiber domain-containing protein [Flavobacteriales bacterium]